jgi:DNA repair exonuclease SbcCD ATPase subunit
MQPTKITIKNFKSIKNISVDLSNLQNQTILLSGNNEDEEGADSNRTGKSNFIKALVWCMFGVSQVDDTNDEIIHYGESSCSVTITMDTCEIERTLKNKTQNFFYRKNGNDVAESNKDAQELFLKDLGINSKNSSVISNSIYLNSQANTLITATPAERLRIFTDWFNLNEFDNKVEKGKEEVKVLELERKGLEPFLNLETDSSKYEETLRNSRIQVNLINSQLTEHEDKQSTYNNFANLKTELLNLLHMSANAEIWNKNIQDAKVELATIDETAINEGEEFWKKEVELITSSLSSLVNSFNQLQKQASGYPLECPICANDVYYINGTLQEFDSVKVAEEIDRISKQIEEIKKKKNDYEIQLNNIRAKQLKIRDLKIQSSKALVIVDDARITELKEKTKEEPKDHRPVITQLKSRLGLLNQEIGRCENLIATSTSNKEKKERAEKRITEIDEELRLYELWIGKRQKVGLLQEIKSFKLTRSVTNLEVLANNYLKSLFRINSGISLTFTVKGIELEQEGGHPVSSMTGGEKARTAFAIALSLSKLYSTNLDLILIDEFFGALDKTGMQLTIDILNKIEGMKFVISHVPVECEHEIVLTKRNGETCL